MWTMGHFSSPFTTRASYDKYERRLPCRNAASIFFTTQMLAMVTPWASRDINVTHGHPSVRESHNRCNLKSHIPRLNSTPSPPHTHTYTCFYWNALQPVQDLVLCRNIAKTFLPQTGVVTVNKVQYIPVQSSVKLNISSRVIRFSSAVYSLVTLFICYIKILLSISYIYIRKMFRSCSIHTKKGGGNHNEVV